MGSMLGSLRSPSCSSSIQSFEVSRSTRRVAEDTDLEPRSLVPRRNSPLWLWLRCCDARYSPLCCSPSSLEESSQCSSGRTVIVTDFLPDGNPSPPTDATCQLLNRSGIQRVLVGTRSFSLIFLPSVDPSFLGHKPWGDSPTTLKLPTLEVLMGDQSYSDVRAPDRRGKAASLIEISGGPLENQAHVEGTLLCGTSFEFSLAPMAPGGRVLRSLCLSKRF